MFDQMSPEILASLIKGSMPTATTTTTKQNVKPAVYCVYSRVKIWYYSYIGASLDIQYLKLQQQVTKK
jgi:hypothetical protein